MITEDGYTLTMSRSDDVINVAAHRLSTGKIRMLLLLRGFELTTDQAPLKKQ